MRRVSVAGIVAGMLPLLPGTAHSGVYQGVAYTPTAMKTMLRAVRYPRARLRRLACTGLGASSNGRYMSFRCVARLRPHGRKVFYAAGAGVGGWLCAGPSVAGCKVLDQGYAAKDKATTASGVAKLAAQGYLQNHFHRTDAPSPRVHPCGQTATNVWTCDYQLTGPPAPPVAIRITLTPVTSGWILTGAASGGPPPF